MHGDQTATATDIIAAGAMSRRQMLIIGLMIGLNALDGFDVLAISFAGPAIAREWALDPGTFGWVLAMELVGMAIGSITLGRIADAIGRRQAILVCLVLMAVGMALSASASAVAPLIASRLLTGLGLGGMLSSLTTATAEFANDRRRSLSLALVGAGYPLAGVICGLVAQQVFLHGASWRVLFAIGAAAAAGFIVPVYLFVPDSVAWLERRNGRDALARINRVLASFALPAVIALAPLATAGSPTAVRGWQARELRAIVILTLAYFFHVFCFFYFLKWTPKIIVDLGFAPASAAGALAAANLGGVLGGIVFGVTANRMGPRRLTIGFLLSSALLINMMGAYTYTLTQLVVLVGLMGFLMTSGVIGIFNLTASAFAAERRASGVGIVIGVGRGGSALAPVVAGYLFAAGFSLSAVSLFMGLASVLAALALAQL